MKPEQGQESPPWMAIAEAEIGTREIPGSESNPRILEYFRSTTLGGKPNDEVPWCSAFANWVLEQDGIRGSRKANARSWLSWGERTEPRVGAVAVLYRGDRDGPNGHVAFLTAVLPNRVVLLGGNQGNHVGRAEYGIGRVLDYRWPRELDRLAPRHMTAPSSS